MRVLCAVLVCLLSFAFPPAAHPQNSPPPSSPPPQAPPKAPEQPPQAEQPPEGEQPLAPDEEAAPPEGEPEAEAPAGATLKGKVTASDRSTPLPGARVHAIGKNGRIATSAPADAKGRYELKGVAPGTYRLAVSTEEGVYTVEMEVGIASASSFTVDLATIPAEGAKGTVPGLDLPPRGFAAIVHGKSKAAGAAAFWGSAGGLVLIGVSVAALALILSGADDGNDQKPVSPSSP